MTLVGSLLFYADYGKLVVDQPEWLAKGAPKCQLVSTQKLFQVSQLLFAAARVGSRKSSYLMVRLMRLTIEASISERIFPSKFTTIIV
jgi:hypothetical protein